MSKRFCLAIAGSIALLAMGASPSVSSAEPIAQVEQTPSSELVSLKSADLSPYINSYADLVYQNYRDSHKQAIVMQRAITKFLARPNASTHRAAQEAWIMARKSYLQTEAFRFYEGPIDFVDPSTGEEGPEGRINAWPMNEAFIDYVRGKANAGLINNPDFEVSIEEILKNDQVTDEADVTTGWHAIEFLLWGQDFNDRGPGQRSFHDFIARRGNNDRRRRYLTLVTQQLVKDLAFLESEWRPNANNYRAEFVKRDPKAAIGDIFTALATLSAFEMASERIAVALDSSSQEDEHSCFSDTTYQDFVFNAKGIKNVYLGDYGKHYGRGFDELVAQLDPELNQQIILALSKTEVAVDNIHRPFDRVLASPAGSLKRKEVEMAITAFEDQAALFQKLGGVLGIKVEILAE